MQKCFYHTKTDATTVCMGCKMPICQTCHLEGKKGFCEACMKKVASLGDRITDQKKTGMVSGSHKATMIKSSSRPTGLKNVTYCFHHFDIVASGTCPTCTRPFCPACLNSSGICSHCATYNEEAQERMFRPSERGKALAADEPRAASYRGKAAGKAPPDAKKLLVMGVVAIVAVVALFAIFKRPAAPPKSSAAETLEKLKSNELTAEEQALLAKLNEQAKHARSLPDLPESRPAGSSGSGSSAEGGQARVLGHAPAARRGGGQALSVLLTSPRAGATLSGLARVQAHATGADQVELLVDGETIRTLTSPPFVFDFATHSVENGRHRLTVVAYGAGGKRASTVAVNVRN